MPLDIAGIQAPDAASIAATREALRPHTRVTPVFTRTDLLGATITFKYELLQAAGTFKARGAFSNLLALDGEQRKAGVTCVSAGNHAIAVAYAAERLGIAAKVVMIRTANPARVAAVRRTGAELVLADDGPSAFAAVHEIERAEGRIFVHPFNGLRTILGTATLGAEWAEQSPDLDAVILPVGGGGLAAGTATAMKLADPDLLIYGVEPDEANGMTQSFAANGPIRMGPMRSIADSLCAPHTEAYSFELCRRALAGLVTVDDAQLRAAMQLLFDELKLAVEPSCAAATAALMGPLRETLKGKHVGILLCGSNTDLATFAANLK